MIILKTKEKEIIPKLVKFLKRGKVMIVPTESVYGLICDAKNKKAVEKIFKIKRRSFQKPISLFVKDLKMAKETAIINKNQEKVLRKVWPGKTIAVLKTNPSTRLRASRFPEGIVCQWGKIGLRIPKHRFLTELLKEFNNPLAQTSANISGKPVSATIKETLKQLGNSKPDLAIDAGSLFGKPSKVIDLTLKKTKILRK